MKKILVATDGSKYSEKTLLKSKEIARDMGAGVTVVSVSSLSHDNVYPGIRSELKKSEIERAKKVLKESEEIFSDFEGEFSTIHKTGDVVDEIVKLAEEGNYDLLIMGRRGLGTFSKTLLGSVSDKVIHHVKISVMIVK